MEVTINGKRGKLLIDSGSFSSILDSKFAKHFNFYNQIDDDEEEVNGLAGTVKLRSVKKVTVSYRGKDIHHKFKTADLNGLFKDIGAVGVLGSDYLIENRLIIDYKNKIIN